jgi:hypothetical protein
MNGGLTTQSLAKLVTILLKEPFMKWGFDFIGLIEHTIQFTNNNIFL